MDASKDYYKILNINQNANADEIKSAYRKLAKKFHPDLHRDNPLADLANEKFKEVNEAYEILSDEKKKKEYNLKRKQNDSKASNKNHTTEKSYSSQRQKSEYNNKQKHEHKNYGDNAQYHHSQHKQKNYSNQAQNSNEHQAHEYRRYTEERGEQFSNQRHMCYMHGDNFAVTQCVVCGAPLCSECAVIFDKPICIDCLTKNNAQFIKHLKIPILITIFTLVFGMIVGAMFGIKFNVFKDFGIVEGLVFSIYLEGIWLYLHYLGHIFKNNSFKILNFILDFFGVSEDIVFIITVFLNIIVSIIIGWAFGLSYGSFKLLYDYKTYKNFKPEYEKTKDFIKQKFGL